ncbi:MAG TPA: hypothetical protein PKY77_00840 [Phycisphaerae bacterium]|nr:hypothetical protein [Phycisphaerae bacterium]HRY67599.1 hypothetical protein [Phycisphaerae bacterium]
MLSRPGVVAAVVLVAPFVLVGVESVVAFAVVLIEGMKATAVLAGAGLAGGWLIWLLGLGGRPWHERVILGAGLGVGFLALAVLGLGCLGLLSRGNAVLLVGVVGLAGLIRLAVDVRDLSAASVRARDEAARAGVRRPGDRMLWLWLLVVPFLALTLLAVCLPPGVLWREEGNAYDILEYHLAVPKAFHDLGRITFLPNNVYSGFPLSYEMLALLMMALRGDAIHAAFAAQFVNVALAVLWLAAAWLAGRAFSPRAGMLAGVLAGVTPWIMYLAGIAYVEIGMLAMGMCALGAMLRAMMTTGVAGGEAAAVGGSFAGAASFGAGSGSGARVASWRWFLLAGMLTGLACGFKYTAVVLIAVPLAVLVVFEVAVWWKKLGHVVLLGLVSAVVFSPWLIRNAINTGNPVYPLGYSVFGSRAGVWDADLEKRWQRAHGSAEAERSSVPMVARVVERTVADERIGPVLILLATWGALVRRDRWTVGLAVMLGVQFVLWLGATHLFARFAVVLLLPLVLLAARLLERPVSGLGRVLLAVVLVLGAGWNFYAIGGLFYVHTRLGPSHEPIQAYDKLEWFVKGLWPSMQEVGAINGLDAGAKVMLIGEARTFYLRRRCDYAVVFNHHPLAQAAREIPDDEELLDWLRQEGCTHVLAHWAELGRLDGTYGLDSGLDDALIQRLMAAGMKEVRVFKLSEDGSPYATLFEVPGHE